MSGPAAAPARVGSWHPFAASVTGAAHLAQHRPNEDACLARRRGPVSVAVVADGHGSSRCPRAGRGAALAVAAIADLLESALAECHDAAEVRRRLIDDAGPALVHRWRTEVHADALERPFSDEELELVGSDGPDLEERALWLAYGCTLVAIGANADVLAVFQIGDGDCVVVSPEQVVTRPLPEDPVNRGNVTSSLSQAQPLDALRCATIDLRRQPQLLAFAASDGFGGAYTETDWWHQVGRDLAQRVARLPLDDLAARLPEWLADPARVGGDDATMGLLVADAAEPVTPGAVAPTAVADPSDPITAPVRTVPEAASLEDLPADPRARKPRWWHLRWTIAGLLVAFLAGATAWFVTSGSDGGAPSTPDVATSTTAPVVKEPPNEDEGRPSTTAGEGAQEADAGADLLGDDPDG